MLGNGSEIKDVQTGLVWQRCSVGQSWTGNTCAGEAKKFTFDDAQKQAGNGWRVPTVRELHSLVWCSTGTTQDRIDPQDGKAALEYRCVFEYTRPTIRQAAFPNTPGDWYWTSTPWASGAWSVNFYDGDVDGNGRSVASHVRLVR